MDPIEEIYQAMKIDSALYSRLHARVPWGINFHALNQVRFGLIVQGECRLESTTLTEPIALGAGDCFVINQHTPFQLMTCAADSPLISCEALFANRPRHETLDWGGDGALTDIIIGNFYFDEEFGSPLFNMLPNIIHIPQRCIHSQLLQATLQMINHEIIEQKLGGQLMIKRLADILLIQAIRSSFFLLEQQPVGWIRGWHDQRLKVVLQAIHTDLQHHWQVAHLAQIAGMSRSAFAAYFKDKIGETPLAYLTRWRIYRAKNLLSNSPLSLLQIGAQIGFETDSVFSRFFKHHTGMTPGQFRYSHKR